MNFGNSLPMYGSTREYEIFARIAISANDFADMAQLAEQLICNQQVNGSTPLIGFLDGFPSGQRGQTVNLLATLSMVRIHLRPLCSDDKSIYLHCLI